jgi:hypothetical protein
MREMNYLGSIITKDYLYTGIKYTIVKGIIELIKKLIRIESRYLLIEITRSMSLIYLINPKLALYLVDEINKYISIYNIRESFNS